MAVRGDEFYDFDELGEHVDPFYNPPTCWLVRDIQDDVAVCTPIYEARHNRVFRDFPLAVVERHLEQTDELLTAWGKQQESEIRAETSIPQHLVW